MTKYFYVKFTTFGGDTHVSRTVESDADGYLAINDFNTLVKEVLRNVPLDHKDNIEVIETDERWTDEVKKEQAVNDWVGKVKDVMKEEGQ